ncbi:Fidgetin-like protein 1 [Coemansia sp. Cherry 401B]|nr:Fidgetin-like protein 1 [Coemansia sp. Cherry 401B]
MAAPNAPSKQLDAQELHVFQRNQFAIEDAEPLVAREHALVNTQHARARFAPLVAASIQQRAQYKDAFDSMHRNLARMFDEGMALAVSAGAGKGPQGSRLDLGQVAKSGVSRESFWRAVNQRPQMAPPAPPRHVARRPVPANPGVVPPHRGPQGLAASKRARSEDSGMAFAAPDRPHKQPQRQPGDAGSDDGAPAHSGPFVTARHQMRLDSVKRQGVGSNPQPADSNAGAHRYNPVKSLNASGRRFVPPARRAAVSDDEGGERIRDPYFTATSNSASLAAKLQRQRGGAKRNIPSLHPKKDAVQQQQPARRVGESGDEGEVDERLKNIDPRMVEMIESDILTGAQTVTWDDIAGLGQAKRAVHMAVIYPLLKPELFQGIRAPPKGLLLFGPPGTGKTLIGRCIASQAGATFFNISASSLTSKWIGEGEKMVRALFAVARVRQPTVIFIDEIDSLLTQRTDGEQEATRRIKTEFLVQLDGCGTSSDDRIILLGATNRPHELDEAARRRFPKRLYVPLPDRGGRRAIVTNLLRKQTHDVGEAQLDVVCDRTDGFSGADMDTLCREAAFGPIRSIADIATANVEDVRPISFADFEYALTQVRPSVSPKDLEIHIAFNRQYGMSAAEQ